MLFKEAFVALFKNICDKNLVYFLVYFKVCCNVLILDSLTSQSNFLLLGSKAIYSVSIITYFGRSSGIQWCAKRKHVSADPAPIPKL